MKIEVIVTGNRSLYRSICESIDRTTTHRTMTGAARALLKAEADAKRWGQNFGRWGSYTITIDGRKLSKDDDMWLAFRVQDIANDTWLPASRVSNVVELIERLAGDQSSES